jgi:hypothetical protein
MINGVDGKGKSTCCLGIQNIAVVLIFQNLLNSSSFNDFILRKAKSHVVYEIGLKIEV